MQLVGGYKQRKKNRATLIIEKQTELLWNIIEEKIHIFLSKIILNANLFFMLNYETIFLKVFLLKNHLLIKGPFFSKKLL